MAGYTSTCANFKSVRIGVNSVGGKVSCVGISSKMYEVTPFCPLKQQYIFVPKAVANNTSLYMFNSSKGELLLFLRCTTQENIVENRHCYTFYLI